MQVRSQRITEDPDVHIPDGLPSEAEGTYHKILHLCQASHLPVQPEIQPRKDFWKQRSEAGSPFPVHPEYDRS